MTTLRYNLQKNCTSYFRLIVFLATPVLYSDISPVGVAIIVIALLLASFAIDFYTGRTTWFSLRPVQIGCLLAYTGFYVWVLIIFDLFSASTLLTMTFLLVFLSSDVIADASRYELVLWAAIISTPTFAGFADPHLRITSVYPGIAAVAALARISFPPPEDLIHTSLDYRFARLEILSFGMKKVIAVGVRRNID